MRLFSQLINPALINQIGNPVKYRNRPEKSDYSFFRGKRICENNNTRQKYDYREQITHPANLPESPRGNKNNQLTELVVVSKWVLRDSISVRSDLNSFVISLIPKLLLIGRYKKRPNQLSILKPHSN